MSTALIVIACFAAAGGQPVIACIVTLAAIACMRKKRLHY